MLDFPNQRKTVIWGKGDEEKSGLARYCPVAPFFVTEIYSYHSLTKSVAFTAFQLCRKLILIWGVGDADLTC